MLSVLRFPKRMIMAHKIAVLAGDGIGPEVLAEAIMVLDAVQKMFGFSL